MSFSSPTARQTVLNYHPSGRPPHSLRPYTSLPNMSLFSASCELSWKFNTTAISLSFRANICLKQLVDYLDLEGPLLCRVWFIVHSLALFIVLYCLDVLLMIRGVFSIHIFEDADLLTPIQAYALCSRKRALLWFFFAISLTKAAAMGATLTRVVHDTTFGDACIPTHLSQSIITIWSANFFQSDERFAVH